MTNFATSTWGKVLTFRPFDEVGFLILKPIKQDISPWPLYSLAMTYTSR